MGRPTHFESVDKQSDVIASVSVKMNASFDGSSTSYLEAKQANTRTSVANRYTWSA